MLEDGDYVGNANGGAAQCAAEDGDGFFADPIDAGELAPVAACEVVAAAGTILPKKKRRKKKRGRRGKAGSAGIKLHTADATFDVVGARDGGFLRHNGGCSSRDAAGDGRRRLLAAAAAVGETKAEWALKHNKV